MLPSQASSLELHASSQASSQASSFQAVLPSFELHASRIKPSLNHSMCPHPDKMTSPRGYLHRTRFLRDQVGSTYRCARGSSSSLLCCCKGKRRAKLIHRTYSNKLYVIQSAGGLEKKKKLFTTANTRILIYRVCSQNRERAQFSKEVEASLEPSFKPSFTL